MPNEFLPLMKGEGIGCNCERQIPSRVTETRPSTNGMYIRRRRLCPECNEKWTTLEYRASDLMEAMEVEADQPSQNATIIIEQLRDLANRMERQAELTDHQRLSP